MGKIRKAYKIVDGKFEWNISLGRKGADGRILLKWILQE
jgi:hypothetical protein